MDLAKGEISPTLYTCTVRLPRVGGNLGCLQKYDRLPVLRVTKHLSPYFSQLLTFYKGALKEGQGVGWKDLDDPPTDFALKLPSFLGCGEQERREKDERMKKEVGVPLWSQ